MPKNENQKLKLLYLLELLEKETDDAHGLSMGDILEKLSAQGVRAERKSIYDDFDALARYGVEVVGCREDTYRYRLATRRFELAELKLLVDAVQSSKFLPAGKSRALIKKLEGLASRYEAQTLQRQVYVANRIKSMNESVYYSIDTIHAAISGDVQITFRYFEWTVQKTARYRHDGRLYCVSPYALIWEDENYYLVAYDAQAQKVKHYRVDKMDRIAATNASREGKALFENFDMAEYAKRTFGMFGGEAEQVTLRFENQLAGAVIDRFGKNAAMYAAGSGHFELRINAVVSPQFMGWIAGFGAQARILAPQKVVASYTDFCRAMLAQYDSEKEKT